MGQRALAGLIATGLLAGLVVARGLEPASSGFGTHQQLGLPACGWLASTGYPCPTCGFTTAFALAARGHFVLAWQAQPMALVAAVGAACGFWVGLHVAVFGSRAGALCAKLLTPGVIWSVALGWAVAWAWKSWTWAH